MVQTPPVKQGIIDVAVDELARRFAVPPSDVEQLVLTQICTLDRTARIKQFVAILAIKHVRDALRKHLPLESSVAHDAP